MMTTTLVAPAHDPGPHVNGHGGCNARMVDGICPGVEHAQWLNSLGEDHEPFGSLTHITNGEVRANWIRGSNHIVPVDPQLAKLVDQKQQLMRDLERVNREINALQMAVTTGLLEAKRRASQRS